MPAIDLALEDDGPAILRITVRAGIFTPQELSCVDEIWNTFQREGEASGYAFLVFRDDYG